MLFMQLDHGEVLCKETGRDTPRIMLYHWQSTHHEGNGQAYSGCRLLRAGYGACG